MALSEPALNTCVPSSELDRFGYTFGFFFSGGLDMDRLVAADAFKIKKDEQINHRHGRGNKRIGYESAAVAFHVRFADHFLFWVALVLRHCVDCAEFRAIETKCAFKEEEFARLLRFVFGEDGGISLLEFLAGEPIFGIAQAL